MGRGDRRVSTGAAVVAAAPLRRVEAPAIEQYLRAIELHPSDASFRLALGISYERLDKGPEAAAAYAEYLRLQPNAPDAEQVRARIALLGGAS